MIKPFCTVIEPFCIVIEPFLTLIFRSFHELICFFSVNMQRVNLKDFLKIPVGEWFHGKIIRHDHLNDITDIENTLESVPELLKMEDRRRFTESCFGHFLHMHREMHFSAGIVHRMLLRELHHDGSKDEMR